jgi:hypothetical protein
MTRARSGGGITMNKNVSGKVRGGSRSADVVSPAGVSQLGAMQGSRLKESGSYTNQSSATPVFSGSKANPVQFGNVKALDVGAGGVGTGRTIYKSGYQSLHGQPVQGSTHARRGLIEEFGPDVPGRRR